MVEIPNALRSVFSGTVRERDGTHVVEIPTREIDTDALTAGETYRIAVLESAARSVDADTSPADDARTEPASQSQGPPVEEGEVRDVTVETVGDQGDGIAKVDRGYVVIVPDARPGTEPTVEIETVRENVAFASVVDGDQASRAR